jgi:prepilin-type N-terminal cleavage/methylation domain-containing protein
MTFPSPENGNPKILNRAFTLIELLVVVAVVMVLVSIALPNFLTAVSRTNVAAAQAEMRSVGAALEMYNVDHKEYPQSALIPPPWRLQPLVTPVAYLESTPSDRFSTNEMRRHGYQYGAMDLDRATRWILVSLGPDRNPDSDPIEFYPGFDPLLFIGLYFEPEAEGDGHYEYMIYSPTNGVTSNGDLYIASDGNPFS